MLFAVDGRLFLSTPSARRATLRLDQTIDQQAISIHALREEGDFHLNFCCFCFFAISIHALREEGDPIFFALFGGWKLFLSTPSARRATI